VFGCGTVRMGSSPDVLFRSSNFEGQRGTTLDSTVPTLDPEPNNLIWGIVPSHLVLSLQPNAPLNAKFIFLVWISEVARSIPKSFGT
jgi:hypothetical protein